MTDTSGFIALDSAETLFDRKELLESSGSTSLSYLVSREGEMFFMKQLRHEHFGDPRFNLIFKKEFAIGSKISHPSIVSYKEMGEDAGGPYILTEYVTGETLEEKLSNCPDYFRNRKNLDKFFMQLLDALEYLHTRNIVYCDLKPANVMLTRINNDVKLIDLGFCDNDDFVFSAGTTKGYSAPELQQCERHELDVRADIYAIGKLMEYIEVKGNNHLPLTYRKVIKRCLNEDKSKRPDSAKVVAEDLRKSKKAVWISAICIAVAVAAAIGWQLFRGSENHKQLMMTLKKDATVEGLHYMITSEDSAACMVIGRKRNLNKDSRTGEVNLYIREKIVIDGKEYRTTEIADSAFCDYPDIVSVNLPNTLREIGEKAFYRNSLIASANIPEGITNLKPKCFYATGIRSVKLPSSLRFIQHASFAICRKLKSVEIPEGVTSLGMDAFGECLSLQSVTLPSTLKTINRGVFWKCRSLKEISIPASVETIGEYAFYHCDSLKHVYNYSPEPQPLSVIFNRKDITIHVPAASVKKYQEAQHWRDLCIVPM